MSLKPIRDEIDKVDDQLIKLYAQRMELSKRVAEYKHENGLPIFNEEREIQVLDSVEKKAGEHGKSARVLYQTIIQLSSSLQRDMLGSGAALKNEIISADVEPPFLSENVRVACFGVAGTYAHNATKKIFPNAQPKFYSPFSDVFKAIQNGEADFGVVPIENSSAGSVTAVYDLMLKYRFHIAAAVDIPVNHCLAVKKGTVISDIKKVFSHEQAISQCSDFIKAHPGITAEEYMSTAASAKMVSEQNDNSIAAICSEEAAKHYGLEVIMRGFQNNPNNCTRFIVISKKLYIKPESDKISLCFALPHVTGSLHNVLCRFAIHGLNLTKIESRPIYGKSFEYLFYVDFSGSVSSKEVLNLLCALSDELSEFSFLGNYIEK